MKNLFFAIILLFSLNSWSMIETKQMSCTRSYGSEWLCFDAQQNTAKSNSESSSKDNPLVFLLFGAMLVMGYLLIKNDREKNNSNFRC